MDFHFQIQDLEEETSIQAFLKSKGLSNRLIKALKLDQGEGIFLNGEWAKAIAPLEVGDKLTIRFPEEPAHPHIEPVDAPLDILFEDDHYLIVNKGTPLLSNPSFKDPEESLSNRVLAYYKRQGYTNQTIHLVTRLDRNTSGAIIFAKHRLAHSLVDQVMRGAGLEKIYAALTPPSTDILPDHGYLDYPIGRSENSIVERRVVEDGKPALTEFWRLATSDQGDLFKIKLHTGRTHQIRVHFSHVGLPLLGDSLYGKAGLDLIRRQALHSYEVAFDHPLTGSRVHVQAPIPEDFLNTLNNKNGGSIWKKK